MPKLHTTLVLPDCHIPFHNKKLLAKVCKLGHDLRPDHLVILGDFGDYYSVSRHHAGSLGLLKDINLGYEYEQQNRILDNIDTAVKKCRKDFIEGNHESNCIRWLQSGDNAKVDGAFQLPPEALRLKERGYAYHPDWKEASVMIGNHLEIVHGEYCTVHAAKKHLDEHEGSVICGHTHRWGSYVTGKRGAYNIGWLGNKYNPAFNYATASQRRKWVNGFAVVYTLSDGSFIPCPVQAWNDKFVFDGRLY